MSLVDTIPLDKLSAPQRSSLQNLEDSATCGLCARLYVRPVALTACGHAFCYDCLTAYSCDNWNCPST
jgi:hypothetical protein